MEIFWAALVLGAMGLLFGLLLTGASKLFAVPSNPKRDAVREGKQPVIYEIQAQEMVIDMSKKG